MSPKRAVVVLGAGASYDVWGGQSHRSEGWRPPLGCELFQHRDDSFAQVLRRYPGARELQQRDLGPLSAASPPLDLEGRLREYASHPDPRTRRLFKQIPPYIRDVIAGVSSNYIGENSGVYAQLVAMLLSDLPHEVAFIVLNYDDLLEKSLARFDRNLQISSLDDYTRVGRQALVVKPHGSINWFRRMRRLKDHPDGWFEALDATDPFAIDDRPIIVRDEVGACSTAFRVSPPGSEQAWVYPVVTAPLAQKTAADLVCPADHLQALARFMRDCKKYLFIGTSAFDSDVLTFVNEHVPEGAHAHYVGEERVGEVRARVEQAIGRFRGQPVIATEFPAGFRAFAYSHEFDRFLQAG